MKTEKCKTFNELKQKVSSGTANFKERNVFNIIKKKLRKNGTTFTIQEKIMSKSNRHSGYKGVILSKNNKKWCPCIHTLVAEAFIMKRYYKKGLVVNHINNKGDDNRLCNLEVVTHKQNTQHAAKHLRMSCGERHYMTSLKEKDVRYIRSQFDKKLKTKTQLSKEFSVSIMSIYHIVNRNTCKHIK